MVTLIAIVLVTLLFGELPLWIVGVALVCDTALIIAGKENL